MMRPTNTRYSFSRSLNPTILVGILFILVSLAVEHVSAQITLEDVKKHSTTTDCWSAIYKKVYDLTAYAPTHPGNGGGSDTVYLLCGKDGTSLYDTFHGNNPQYLDNMPGIEFKGELGTHTPTEKPSTPPRVATISPTNPPTQKPTPIPTTQAPTTLEPTFSPTETTHFTLDMIAPHKHPSDCWTSIYGKVYDLTVYAPLHPGNGGGSKTVYLLCGIEGSELYDSFHGNNPQYLQGLLGIVFKGVMVNMLPTESPTKNPTERPTTPAPTTSVPSSTPSHLPSLANSSKPSVGPSFAPSVEASLPPSEMPTEEPSFPPSNEPTADPSFPPTEVGSAIPSFTPSAAPSIAPTTPPPTISPHPTFSPTQTSFHTLEMVVPHNHPNDCWSVIHGKVYDLTAYAPNHPGNGGGQQTVHLLCGIQGSGLYDSFHGNNPQYLEQLPEIFFKGLSVEMLPTDPPSESPSATPTTAAPTTLTPSSGSSNVPTIAQSNEPSVDPSFGPNGTPTEKASSAQAPSATGPPIYKVELAQHNTPDDCWVSYYSEVFDVTEYAPSHPAGAALVTQNCGHDDTESYSFFHTYEELEEIRQYFKGFLTEGAQPAAPEPSHTPGNTQSNTPMPMGCHDDSSEDSDEEPCMTMASQPTPAVTGPPISLEELAQHNTPSDCWVSYYSEIFDVTEYAPTHPAGAALVTQNCGKDDTASYSMFHTYDELAEIRRHFKGILSEGTQTQETERPPAGHSQSTPSTLLDSANAAAVTEDATILSANGMILFSTLQQHSTPEDCWVSYFGEVYSMTRYAPEHPVGSESITADCGKDGTESYKAFHERSLLVLVKQDYLGELDTTTIAMADTNPPRLEPTALTMEEVASHDNPGSCWVRYYDSIYDLTYYSHPSPPGQSVIYSGCGKDDTMNFASAHPRNLLDDVEEHKIGWIESSAARGSGLGLGSVFFAIAPLVFVLA